MPDTLPVPTPSPTPTPALVTLGEAARYLGITPRTLMRWVATGHFPQPLRLGADKKPRVRFRRSDIHNYLEQHQGGGAA